MAARAASADGVVGVQTTIGPGREAAPVARVAIGRRGDGDRLVRDVIGGSSVGGREGTAVAASALARNGGLRVCPFGRLPSGRAHVVARETCRAADRHVGARLGGGGLAVVAPDAVGCGVELAVVDLGTRPAAGAAVAAFAAGDAVVQRVGGLGHCVHEGAAVAASAATGHSEVGVNLAVGPRAETAFVAGIAIGRRRRAYRRIGYVIGGAPVGRWVGAAMAARALAAHRRLGVVPGRGAPSRETLVAVVAGLVGSCWHVLRRLGGGLACAVAARTSACNHPGVVEVRGRRPGAGAVAGVALRGGLNVGRRLAAGLRAIVATLAAAGDDDGVIEARAGVGLRRMAGLTGQRRWHGYMLLRLDDVAAREAHARHVARGAIARCPLENPVQVARFATRLNMRPSQGEAGLEVVEHLLLTDPLRKTQACSHHHAQQQHACGQCPRALTGRAKDCQHLHCCHPVSTPRIRRLECPSTANHAPPGLVVWLTRERMRCHRSV